MYNWTPQVFLGPAQVINDKGPINLVIVFLIGGEEVRECDWHMPDICQQWNIERYSFLNWACFCHFAKFNALAKKKTRLQHRIIIIVSIKENQTGKFFQMRWKCTAETICLLSCRSNTSKKSPDTVLYKAWWKPCSFGKNLSLFVTSCAHDFYK